VLLRIAVPRNILRNVVVHAMFGFGQRNFVVELFMSLCNALTLVEFHMFKHGPI
jgi:hypothetical protein